VPSAAGFLFLGVVRDDLRSRPIAGWAMATDMRTGWCRMRSTWR
jgi:hypothetical protein